MTDLAQCLLKRYDKQVSGSEDDDVATHLHSAEAKALRKGR